MANARNFQLILREKYAIEMTYARFSKSWIVAVFGYIVDLPHSHKTQKPERF